jgi:hypothetical protein
MVELLFNTLLTHNDRCWIQRLEACEAVSCGCFVTLCLRQWCAQPLHVKLRTIIKREHLIRIGSSVWTVCIGLYVALSPLSGFRLCFWDHYVEIARPDSTEMRRSGIMQELSKVVLWYYDIVISKIEYYIYIILYNMLYIYNIIYIVYIIYNIDKKSIYYIYYMYYIYYIMNIYYQIHIINTCYKHILSLYNYIYFKHIL